MKMPSSLVGGPLAMTNYSLDRKPCPDCRAPMTQSEEALLPCCGPCFVLREGTYIDLPRDRSHEARVSSVQAPVVPS